MERYPLPWTGEGWPRKNIRIKLLRSCEYSVSKIKLVKLGIIPVVKAFGSPHASRVWFSESVSQLVWVCEFSSILQEVFILVICLFWFTVSLISRALVPDSVNFWFKYSDNHQQRQCHCHIATVAATVTTAITATTTAAAAATTVTTTTTCCCCCCCCCYYDYLLVLLLLLLSLLLLLLLLLLAGAGAGGAATTATTCCCCCYCCCYCYHHNHHHQY